MVKQVRVIRNVLIMGLLFTGILWLDRDYWVTNKDALVLGALGGLGYGWFYWHRLSSRIARTDRRFERNKIFVSFLSAFEVGLAALAVSHYVLIALAVLLLTGIILDFFSGHWWTVFIGGFGGSAAMLLAVRTLCYEHGHGPLYYQYDSRFWMGGEGMLYQVGQVVEPLTPCGLITVNGELWQAISLSGETIAAGESIEVISRQGLVVYVDHLRPGDDKSP